MKIGIILILVFCLFGCEQIGLSESETIVIKEVLNEYGGDYSISKGFRNDNGVKTNYLNLSLNNSEFKNISKENLDLICTGIAFSINSKFNEIESSCQLYTIELKYNNKAIHTKPFNKSFLDEIIKFKQVYDEMSLMIQEKKYIKIKDLCDPVDPMLIDYDVLGAQLDTIAIEFGEINKIIFQGFETKDFSEKPIRRIRLVGKHARDSEETFFALHFDRDSGFVIGLEM